MSSDIEHRIRIGLRIVTDHIAYFRKNLGRFPGELKADATRVTEADLRLSADISAALRAAFPADDLVSEEALPEHGDRPLNAEFCWVLDPIDGTNNYARGNPTCAISLGLLRHGSPAYGIIYDNARDRIVHGGPGFGITDGTTPMVTPTPQEPFDKHAIVSFHFPMPEAHLGKASPILRTNGVRCSGSCAMNLTHNALGIIDGSVDHNTKVWDVAAACALIAEAGRTIIFPGKQPFPLRKAEAQPTAYAFIAGTAAFIAAASPRFADA